MNETSLPEAESPRQGWLRLLKRVYPFIGIRIEDHRLYRIS
ncbi:hypothetical protein SCARR_00185 [Pontiella sulfatireligans]|uniref:Uncharacterized protein n=1 Tax=Pontiella sulfatireligans TaxID=2750658 RepID=A0A6C2UFH2_9BACT|nr:hypothetical protein SCARR_00185 [Pontiella sulfatireligans]